MEFNRGRLFRMKNFHTRNILIVVAVLFAAAPNDRAQQNATGHAKDFTSVEYFEAPNQKQMKSRLSGASAQPQAGGLLVIKQLKLEKFNENGKVEMIARAPECVYDTMNGIASSPGKLQLETGDGKLRVDGEGFLWRQSDYLLTISNHVHTVIETEPGAKRAL
jgi:hypothetical protein